MEWEEGGIAIERYRQRSASRRRRRRCAAEVPKDGWGGFAESLLGADLRMQRGPSASFRPMILHPCSPMMKQSESGGISKRKRGGCRVVYFVGDTIGVRERKGVSFQLRRCDGRKQVSSSQFPCASIWTHPPPDSASPTITTRKHVRIGLSSEIIIHLASSHAHYPCIHEPSYSTSYSLPNSSSHPPRRPYPCDRPPPNNFLPSAPWLLPTVPAASSPSLKSPIASHPRNQSSSPRPRALHPHSSPMCAARHGTQPALSSPIP